MIASAKYPFACHFNLNHKVLSLTLHFPIYFKYFQSKHFFFLKVLDNYDWTDLLLMKQVIHWKYYRKSEAVTQQCSVKLWQFSKRDICNRVPFRKAVSPHVSNCTNKDIFPGVFLWIDFVNTICFRFISFRHLFRCCKIGLLKKFGKLTGKHLHRSFFLIRLYTNKPATLLKRNFSTDVSLWILRYC